MDFLLGLYSGDSGFGYILFTLILVGAAFYSFGTYVLKIFRGNGW